MQIQYLISDGALPFSHCSGQNILFVRGGGLLCMCIYLISCDYRELILWYACVSVFVLDPLRSVVPCQEKHKEMPMKEQQVH